MRENDHKETQNDKRPKLSIWRCKTTENDLKETQNNQQNIQNYYERCDTKKDTTQCKDTKGPQRHCK